MARKSRKNMMPQAAVQEAVQQNEKELLRTAAYARLSVENGGHETEDSLHTQILQIHNYIRENPELTLTDTYADNGFTGTRFDRPEFERMMQDVRTGKIQCIVVKDLSRFGRDYIDQLWAEAMTIYNRGNYKLAFSPAMQETLQAHQQDFMQEDAQAGMIYAFLEDYAGDRVCSKQLYAEALGNTNIPAEWETRAICEIMNTGISRGDIQGWQAHKTAKRYPKYGVQKGWERVTSPETGAENFSEITDAEAQQLGFPF